jgi:anti-sigma-K factor RskA
VNIQEYISTGIIESYVLGLASSPERAEFEAMCSAHPEIQKARDEFEQSLEKYFLDNSGMVKAAPWLKEKIFAEIQVASSSNQKTQERAAVYPLQAVKTDWWRFIAVAAVILLLFSTIMNYYFFAQYRKYSNKYEELASSQIQMATSNQILQTKLQDFKSALNLMKDPAMAIVKMSSLPTSPFRNSLATVYWDTRTKDVYLLANNLPTTVSNKQYQLWALVDGKPIDAGVIEIKEGLSFIKMKNIPRAQSFAITLEKRGGSDAPNLSAMYVMGKVTG